MAINVVVSESNSRTTFFHFFKQVDAARPEMGGKHKHVAEEWIDEKVAASGKTKSAQQQSLQKKIHCHWTSDFHNAAEKTVETLTAEVMRDQFLTTDRVFRTVYKIAKSGKPYTVLETDKHPSLEWIGHGKEFTFRKILCKY